MWVVVISSSLKRLTVYGVLAVSGTSDQSICINDRSVTRLSQNTTMYVRVCLWCETLPYTCVSAWNAVNQYHIRVRVKRIGNSATVGETKLTLRQKRKPYPHRDETRGTPDTLLLSRRSGSSSSRRQDNSYYNWDQNRCHHSDVNVNGEILGKHWVNVGRLLGLPPEWHFSSALRSGSDCSEIDRVDGSRKAEKAISEDSGRIAHVATKMALNRFWRLLPPCWW